MTSVIDSGSMDSSSVYIADTDITCPCCGCASVVVNAYNRERIVRELSSLMGNKGIQDCKILDYQLRGCRSCNLEFADPMVEPPTAFYNWLGSTRQYYPTDRWEWRECRQRLQLSRSGKRLGSCMIVVDVGCGSGGFLRMFDGSADFRAIGLDVNSDAVDECLTRGLEAVCGTLSDLRNYCPDGIHAITFWHVVEHVSDPIGMLREAASQLSNTGSIYFSVPLSPQSYERSWHDPLNAPPHHLTRWSIPALHALAANLEMKMDLILPAADSMAARVLRSLTLQAVSPFSDCSQSSKLLRLLRLVMKRPWLPFVEIGRQMNSPQVDGRVRPDLALVCLRIS